MPEQRDNSCVLFTNKKKEKETQPDYRGQGIVHGIPVKLAAWLKSSDKAGKFLTIKVEDATNERAQHAANRAPGDDGAPF